MRSIRPTTHRLRGSVLAPVLLTALIVVPWRLVPRSAAAEPAAGSVSPNVEDPEAAALLSRARKALQAPGLKADYEARYGSTTVRWRIAFLKPGYGRMELVPSEGQPGQTMLWSSV